MPTVETPTIDHVSHFGIPFPRFGSSRGGHLGTLTAKYAGASHELPRQTAARTPFGAATAEIQTGQRTPEPSFACARSSTEHFARPSTASESLVPSPSVTQSAKRTRWFD